MANLNRRTFTTLLAGSAAALAGCASLVHPYDRVVDMVDDLGCDPTGTVPCDDAIRRVAADDTLLRFPSGTYLISRPTVLDGIDRLGIVGSRNTRFRPPDGFNGKLLNLQVGELEFRNVDIFIEADNTTAGLRVIAERGFCIENVEFHGRGTHSDENTVSALSPAVTDPDGVGVVKNLVAKKGSAWGHYKGGGGRGGIHVGGDHKGTIRIVDCHLEEFGNNGIYGNDTPGNVQVEGGIYRNNNVAGIRIGGGGSYVDGALVEVDPAKYTGPYMWNDNSFNMRGIIVAQKPEKWGWKDAGVEIRNCEISIAKNPSGSSAAIHAWHTARTVSVSDTTIRMDEDSPAIRRAPQQDTETRPSSTGARWIHCDNVTITGSARGSPAIWLQDADGSRVRNSSIRLTGNGCDGILFEESVDCTVDGGRIETTRYPIYIQMRERSMVDLDVCLVTFKNGPRLRTSDQWLAALRDDDTVTTTLQSNGPLDGWLAPERCLDQRTLQTLTEGQPTRTGNGKRNEARNVAVADSGNRSLVVSLVGVVDK